jgi:hypothetical protein
MLEEPPLIVRMRGLAVFMDDSFVIMAGNGDINPCYPFLGSQGQSRARPNVSALGDFRDVMMQLGLGVFIISAIGFERIPTEPPLRSAEVSFALYSLSLDV